MTEKPVDSGQEGEGVQGDANPQTSTPQDVKPNLQDIDTFVNALVEHPRFAEALGKTVQSVKDRRFNKLERNQKGFAEQLAEFQELTTGDGAVSPKVALKLMELLDGSADVPPDPGKVEGTPKVDYGDVVASMGLDPGDAEVVRITLNGGDFAANVNKLAVLAKTKRQASATAATSQGAPPMPVGGGSPVAQADLQTQYNAELNNVRQGDVAGLNALKAKYRKLGLPVY